MKKEEINGGDLVMNMDGEDNLRDPNPTKFTPPFEGEEVAKASLSEIIFEIATQEFYYKHIISN